MGGAMMPIDVRKLEARRRLGRLWSDPPALARSRRPRRQAENGDDSSCQSGHCSTQTVEKSSTDQRETELQPISADHMTARSRRVIVGVEGLPDQPARTA